MEKTSDVKSKKKNSMRKISAWWSIPICIVVLIIGVISTYCYYKVPIYEYPKKLNTYKLDRKCTMTPDGAYNVFLKAVHDNDTDLMRAVVREDAIKDYAVQYYRGVTYNYWLEYLLERINKDISKEYGEDWYDNVVINGISKTKGENLTYGDIDATCKGKTFTFKYTIEGFNDRYTLKNESIKPLFDVYMYDDANRPGYIYNDFVR
ncbi:hypothetical protein [Clostridium frigidicarnis]|uniref:Uncharacterized protein n=1 Tax=Clostridium frigidicarnis TaxID=84698 RepID=A0A1I0ZC90_9CLOT|nr:hypothetical protein [Clostridium frigidicarnis]SFB22038.1 hypothetical protein SAMN04488528_101858 [Clostridium frigidicarnis]